MTKPQWGAAYFRGAAGEAEKEAAQLEALRIQITSLASAYRGRAKQLRMAAQTIEALEDDADIIEWDGKSSLLDAALDHYQAIIMRLEKENERLRGVIRQYEIDRQPEPEMTDE